MSCLIFHSSTAKAQNLSDGNSGTRPAISDYRDQILGQFYSYDYITYSVLYPTQDSIFHSDPDNLSDKHKM